MRVISLPDFRGFSTILCKVLSLSIKSLTDYLNDWDNDAFQAIDLDPSNATLWSNRSLCWLLLGMAETALEDAKQSRTLRPDSVIACYREGAALHELQVCGFWSSDLISNSSPTCLSLDGDMCMIYVQLWQRFFEAAIVFYEGANLEPENQEYLSAFR